MAITRAQQVRQMLEDGGMLVQPSMTGKRPGYRGKGSKESKDNRFEFDAKAAAASKRGSGVGSTYDSPAQSFKDSVPESSYDAPTGAVDDKFKGPGQSPDYFTTTNLTGYDTETNVNTPPTGGGGNNNVVGGGDGSLQTLYNRGVPESNFPGGLGFALNFFKDFRDKGLRRNID